MTSPATAEPNTALLRELNDIEGWLLDHNFDVDGAAFRHATRKALVLAFEGRRVPNIPDGALALEVACALAGRTLLPGLLDTRLPGVRELINGTNDHRPL